MAEIQMKDDKFYIHMFEQDYYRIKRWVLQFPNLETGGTLFGLWKNKRNLIAHFVLGPGECCKRTNVSFFQDISYLETVGNSLTHDYMICHIGEWHSHHKIRLYKPSSGDESTVVRNYPQRACGFALIIANIVSSDTVALSPYLFTEETCTRRYGAKYDTGEIVYIPSESPFRNLKALNWEVTKGEEKYTRSDTGANKKPQADARIKKYEPTLYEENTKKYSMEEREARHGMDSESNRRNDLKNKEGNSPKLFRVEGNFVGETDKQSKAAANLNSPASVELSVFQSTNSTATTTTEQNTTISTSGFSGISTSVIGSYRCESSGLGNKTHQNIQTNSGGVATLQPRKQDTTHQPANYQPIGRSQQSVLTKPISNTAYGGARITTSSTAEHWTNPSFATEEPVLQKAGLDPPRVSNPGQYTTDPLGANTYSNEPLRAQVPHGRPSQLACGSDPLRNTHPSAVEQPDQLYINPYQWYSTDSGQNDLKQFLLLLSPVADGDVEMSRNQITHDLQMKFSHHGTKWVVECSPQFPQQGAKLNKERYDISKKTYCKIYVKLVLKTKIGEIANELMNEVKRHCNKC